MGWQDQYTILAATGAVRKDRGGPATKVQGSLAEGRRPRIGRLASAVASFSDRAPSIPLRGGAASTLT
jgi:hypothetical protein